MPRALLVNPWIEDFTAFDFWARPLGLLELGAWLRSADYRVSLIDCLDVNYPGRIDPLPRKKSNGSGKFDQAVIAKPAPLAAVRRRFKRYGMPVPAFCGRLASHSRPDIILVNSMMTYWYTGVAHAVAELKATWPEVPLILGGVYATLLPNHAAAISGVDWVAAGEFQIALPPILKEFGLPSPASGDEPFPAWDLYSQPRAGAILTGRGCPYRCPYCSVPVMHPRLRRRDPEAVIDEVERLTRDFKVNNIAIFDDAIRAGGDERLVSLLTGVIDRGLKVRFHAINALHLKGISRELAGLLRRAGVSTLRFGLETADPDRAAKLGGKASVDDLYQAAANLKACGYQGREIGVYLLAGLPGQPPGEIEAGIDAVLKAGARPYLSEYSPVPASPMWEEALATARFDIAAEPLFHNKTLLACAHPGLDEREFLRLKDQARKPFYGLRA